MKQHPSSQSNAKAALILKTVGEVNGRRRGQKNNCKTSHQQNLRLMSDLFLQRMKGTMLLKQQAEVNIYFLNIILSQCVNVGL